MVAPRIPADTTSHTGPDPEDSESSQYIETIDQTQARYDADSADVQVYDVHEVFKPKPRLTRQEKRELAIKQAALRIAAGIELRSLRVLGQEIGCEHTAIDNAVLRICEKLGIRKFHVSDTTRRKQSEARKRQLEA